MTSLYSSGLMTELKGRIIIENTGYHGEAFITSKKCNRHEAHHRKWNPAKKVCSYDDGYLGLQLQISFASY